MAASATVPAAGFAGAAWTGLTEGAFSMAADFVSGTGSALDASAGAAFGAGASGTLRSAGFNSGWRPGAG
ncbi:hypothetical protein, partial [Methylobacterium sp. WL18]|uniref:hypothetical protein n=1 Tax=Methylobacterium sp. WL18 TaxID=2603897 RepID=UPI001AEEF0DF